MTTTCAAPVFQSIADINAWSDANFKKLCLLQHDYAAIEPLVVSVFNGIPPTEEEIAAVPNGLLLNVLALYRNYVLNDTVAYVATLKQAIERGSARAAKNLGGVSTDFDDKIKYYTFALDNGENAGSTCYDLAECYSMHPQQSKSKQLIGAAFLAAAIDYEDTYAHYKFALAAVDNDQLDTARELAEDVLSYGLVPNSVYPERNVRDMYQDIQRRIRAKMPAPPVARILVPEQPSNHECDICTETCMDDEWLSFNCGHAMCVGCTIQHREKHADQALQCPFCRAVVTEINGTAEALGVFALNI